MNTFSQLDSEDISSDLVNEWLSTFKQHGGTADMLQRSIAEPRRLAKFIEMNNRIVTPAELESASRVFMAAYKKGVSAKKKKIFWSTSGLWKSFRLWLKGDLVFEFFDPGLSILMMRDLPIIRDLNLISDEDWYDEFDWATAVDMPKRRKLCTVIASADETSFDAMRLLQHREEIIVEPRVAVTLYALLALSDRFLQHHIRTLCNFSQGDADDYHVVVAKNRDNSVVIRSNHWHDRHHCLVFLFSQE